MRILYNSDADAQLAGERALGFGLVSARRLTLLTPLLRHLQLPIVCIRL